MTGWDSLLLVLITIVATALPGSSPRLPPTNAPADYQLGGAYAPRNGVAVVTRDRTDKPAPGLYNICYVNAFQTQPGQLTWWKSRHPDLLLRSAGGKLVNDPGWPDEILLDIRTESKRTELLRIVSSWFKGCSTSGFQAVEPDNLDSWTRSRGLLTRAQAISFARTIAVSAHDKNLAIAQKNTADVNGSTLGFDFAVAEECEVYRECSSYLKNFGNHVIEIEYSDNGRAAYRRACEAQGHNITILLRDRDLVTPRNRHYTYEAC
ncbi:MAG: endo alpha-1,4 polygalactosaminidase [Aeromicrobium sp.]